MSQFFNSNPAPSGPRRGPWPEGVPRTWRAALGLPDPDGAHEGRTRGPNGLGPEDGTLSLRTGRTGAAAKAGHDLVIHVTAWEATFVVAEEPGGSSLTLDVDGGSLRVHEGSGGMKALTDDDKVEIARVIDEEILMRQGITFRSTRVQPASGAGGLRVEGDLTLVGQTRPIALDLAITEDGAVRGAVVIRQTDWGITPYSTLFGALKVADEVEVAIDARRQSL